MVEGSTPTTPELATLKRIDMNLLLLNRGMGTARILGGPTTPGRLMLLLNGTWPLFRDTSRCLVKVSTIASALSLISFLALAGVSRRPTSERITPSLLISFDRINVEHGLSHAGAYCILKDRQGFMWFGTAKGLNRYDGYSFKVFQEEPGKPDGISGNVIFTLLEDRSGHIWIGSVGGGLNRFDPVRETFTHYRNNPRDPKTLSDDRVYAILEDKSGRLWIGTRNGLDLFDERQQQFAHFDPEDAAHPITNQVTAIYERPAEPGVLWIGTWGGGLKRFDCASRSFVSFKHNPKDPQSLSHNSIWFIYEAGGYPEILWIGTCGGGLNQFDIASKRFTIYRSDADDPATLSHDDVRSMVQDHSGIFWVGTSGGGLNRFDPVSGRFVHYQSDPKNARSLSNDHVISLFEDETGVHWVGTREGVNRFRLSEEKFLLYQHDPGDPKSLTDNFLYSICEDRRGALWIASGKGLNRFNPSTETFVGYVHNPKDPATLRNNYVRTIYEDREGTLWVGNTSGILHRFDGRSGHAKAYTILNDPRNESVDDILSMLECRDRTFWVGTTEGLHTFDRQTGRHTPISLPPLGRDRAALCYVTTLHEDRQGTLWIGTRYDGLLAYNRRTGNTTVFRHAEAEEHSLRSDGVAYVGEDRSGTLWVATYGGGLNRFDGGQSGFTAFTTKDGLPDDFVYGFLEDNADNLWLSTDKGLCMFNPATKTCTNFDTRYGLQGSEFNSRSFCRSATGTMYFGGVNGLTVFHPDNLTGNGHVPPVFVTAFKSFDRAIRTDTALSYLTGITLPYYDNFLSFEFAALDYRDQVHNRYAYMLVGLDKEWIQSGTRRYAAYTNLDPGDYVFRVKGSNNSGVWNDAGTSLHITITPSFLQTLWFRLIAAGICGGIITLVCYIKVSRINKKKLLQEEFSMRQIESQEAERKRLAAELHDGLGQDLLVMCNEVHQILHEGGEPAQRLQQVATRLQESIEGVREMASNLHPHQLDRLGFRTAIEAMAGAIGRSSGLSIELSCDSVDHFLPRETEIHTYRIIQEALSNVVRHAKATKAKVQLRNTPGYIEIEVMDNGQGFNQSTVTAVRSSQTPAVRMHGFGLTSMSERARIIGGKLTIESVPGSGSRVVLTVPHP